jgi:DNA-binding transcriptional MerR regulator
MATTEQFWTIDELGARVALALAADYEGPPNGRVRALPDRRTIRYYTTLGLLDRAAMLRGRTALYGRRHLLQLVAIKRLQARGVALADLQQQLLGLSNADLARLAQLPADLEKAAAPADEPDQADQRSNVFWKDPPAPVADADANGPPSPSVILPTSSTTNQCRGVEEPLQGVRLDNGVTLLLAACRRVDDDDIAAMRVVAAPLLKLLVKRRLLLPRHQGGSP